MKKEILRLVGLLTPFGRASERVTLGLDDFNPPEDVAQLREIVSRHREGVMSSAVFDSSATTAKLDEAIAALNGRYDTEHLLAARDTLLSLFRFHHNDPETMAYAMDAFRRIGDATPDRHLATDLCIAAACVVPRKPDLDRQLAREWNMTCGHLHAGIAMGVAASNMAHRQTHPAPSSGFR